MTWLAPLLVSLLIGGGLVGAGFVLGRWFEQQQPEPQARVIHLPVRHPSQLPASRPARHVRTVHGRPTLRVVAPLYDFDQEPA